MRAGSPWWQREGAWSTAAAIIVHVAVGWWLLQPRSLPVEEQVMEFVLVTLPAEAAPPPPVAPPVESQRWEDERPPSPPVVPASARTDAGPAVPAIDARPAPAPVPVIRADDRWDQPRAGERHDFRPDPLGRRPEAFAAPLPERFVMREAPSPRDIVRGVAQLLGFWPPGYSDDPCGGIRRSVELLSGADDAVSRRRLAEAVQAKAKYCQ